MGAPVLTDDVVCRLSLESSIQHSRSLFDCGKVTCFFFFFTNNLNHPHLTYIISINSSTWKISQDQLVSQSEGGLFCSTHQAQESESCFPQRIFSSHPHGVTVEYQTYIQPNALLVTHVMMSLLACVPLQSQ